MKVTLLTIHRAFGVFKKIVNEPVEAKSAYWICKMREKLQKEYNLIEETRQKLIKKYADEPTEEQKKVGQLVVSKEKQGVFFKEFDEFLNTKVSLDIPKLKFDYIKDIKLSAAELSLLESFVDSPTN